MFSRCNPILAQNRPGRKRNSENADYPSRHIRQHVCQDGMYGRFEFLRGIGVFVRDKKQPSSAPLRGWEKEPDIHGFHPRLFTLDPFGVWEPTRR